jgi:hypothetical protein
VRILAWRKCAGGGRQRGEGGHDYLKDILGYNVKYLVD